MPAAIEPFRVAIDDQRTIVATRFLPAGAPRAVVLLAPAMGTTQRFYEPLAAWLAGEGFAVVTFDYWGSGASLDRPLREVCVDLTSWARFDCDAMIDAACAVAPGRPLVWLGHSLGAQLLGLVPAPERIFRAVTVAACSGYWLENVPALRLKVWWLWFVVVPIALRVWGYFPGKKLRKVGDLPRGVMAQWRRWCLDREYSVGAEGPTARASYAAVRIPLTSLSFVDDEMMSRANIESLHSFFSGAEHKNLRLSPAEVGLERIGHFGFFRPRCEAALWRPILLPEVEGASARA